MYDRAARMRSLTLNSLPNTLISSETYSPPPLLINGYRAQLQALNLLDVARTARPSGRPIVGGVTLDDTHDHFIWRYLNSATRIERIVLDIRATFDLVPDKLLQTLAGGKIAILDVACGCGATVLALTNHANRRVARGEGYPHAAPDVNDSRGRYLTLSTSDLRSPPRPAKTPTGDPWGNSKLGNTMLRYP